MIRALRLTLVLLLITTTGCRFYYGMWRGDFSGDPSSYAQRAEKLRASGDLEGALEAYRKHFERRLSDPRRPSDENPYFYYLPIGDVLLQMGKAQEAKESYVTAKEHEVDAALVIDRIRQLADHYVTKKEYAEALKILRAYRSMDVDIFDADIDALHKKSVAEEDHYAR
ncbi:MAG: hypothetical protein IT290_06245 [Deltaproteobacteria bacterium]|nr:hypothetical protein [Deltaproteobacteria bacterium]